MPDVVLIPGMPAMALPLYGPLGSRIPPEDALRELLGKVPEVVIPAEKLNEIRNVLSDLVVLSERMKGDYEKLERRAIHPILKAFAREAARNEEQHMVLLGELLGKYGK